jgi:hypothetical protein
MTAPRIRFSEGETEFERELLASWGAEQPSEEARKAALAVALPAVGTAVAGSLAAEALLKPVAAAGSVTAKAAALGWPVVHWIALGSVVMAAAGGVAVRYPPARLHLPMAVRAPASAPPLPVSRATAPSPAAPLTPRTDARGTPSVLPQSGAVSKATTQRSPTRQEASAVVDNERSKLGLGQEVAALDRARGALANGDAPAALRLLDRYESSFPNANLTQEATILRIEALLKQGSRRAAVDLGNSFLAEHPESSHSARVSRLLLEGSNM